jgi:hypothetical protein
VADDTELQPKPVEAEWNSRKEKIQFFFLNF